MSTNFVSDIIENHSNESSMLTLTESRIGTHLLEQGYCIMSAKNSNIENLDAMKLLQKALKENWFFYKMLYGAFVTNEGQGNQVINYERAFLIFPIGKNCVRQDFSLFQEAVLTLWKDNKR